MNSTETVGKGVFGIGGTGLAILANTNGELLHSVQVWIPWGLGVAVSLGMTISIGLDIRRKWRDRNK